MQNLKYLKILKKIKNLKFLEKYIYNRRSLKSIMYLSSFQYYNYEFIYLYQS